MNSKEIEQTIKDAQFELNGFKAICEHTGNRLIKAIEQLRLLHTNVTLLPTNEKELKEYYKQFGNKEVEFPEYLKEFSPPLVDTSEFNTEESPWKEMTEFQEGERNKSSKQPN